MLYCSAKIHLQLTQPERVFRLSDMGYDQQTVADMGLASGV